MLSLSHVRCANTKISKATVQKIISEILPSSSGIGFTRDARDLLIECCVEFITLISSEANEISEKESKKTIACEHITKALERLGFGDYVQDIVNVASEHKEQLKGMMTYLCQKKSPYYDNGLLLNHYSGKISKIILSLDNWLQK